MVFSIYSRIDTGVNGLGEEVGGDGKGDGQDRNAVEDKKEAVLVVW